MFLFCFIGESKSPSRSSSGPLDSPRAPSITENQRSTPQESVDPSLLRSTSTESMEDDQRLVIIEETDSLGSNSNPEVRYKGPKKRFLEGLKNSDPPETVTVPAGKDQGFNLRSCINQIIDSAEIRHRLLSREDGPLFSPSKPNPVGNTPSVSPREVQKSESPKPAVPNSNISGMKVRDIIHDSVNASISKASKEETANPLLQMAALASMLPRQPIPKDMTPVQSPASRSEKSELRESQYYRQLAPEGKYGNQDTIALMQASTPSAQVPPPMSIPSRSQGSMRQAPQPLKPTSPKVMEKLGHSLPRYSLPAKSQVRSSQQAALQPAALQQASLQQASLQQASLQQASLQQASLQQASLQQASLQQASLQQASLQQASLQQASLQQASLQVYAKSYSPSVTAGLTGVIVPDPSFMYPPQVSAPAAYPAMPAVTVAVPTAVPATEKEIPLDLSKKASNDLYQTSEDQPLDLSVKPTGPRRSPVARPARQPPAFPQPSVVKAAQTWYPRDGQTTQAAHPVPQMSHSRPYVRTSPQKPNQPQVTQPQRPVPAVYKPLQVKLLKYVMYDLLACV